MGCWTEDSLDDWRVLNDPAANLDPHRVPTQTGDWHAQRTTTEPRCGADQWRTRDRNEVMYMHEMTDQHLGHCIRFAGTKRQHSSRLSSLLAERAQRTTPTTVQAAPAARES